MKHFLALLLISVLLITLPTPVLAKEKTIHFSPEANLAIHNLAQDILINGLNPSITELKPQLDPQDYAIVQQIKLLPDSPFYIFKRGWRQIQLFFTFDQVGKTHQRLKNSHEKTLEAMLLLEKASKERDGKKHDRLITLTAQTIDLVGVDFEKAEKNIEQLKQKKSPHVASLQDETFRFAGEYLKHQILLQKQEDLLNSADFLAIESARVKHLESLAHIVVASNRDPEVFAEQLVEIVSPQVGSNYSRLSVMALLRDLENNATKDDDKLLQTAQSILKKEVEAKLAKLPKTERLAQVERYSDFIHGNPIRQFQAYNLLSKSFSSEEMRSLTFRFKDTAAQNFKNHLGRLETEADRQIFAQTLFSSDPIDLRPLMYTEIQLQKKVLGVSTTLAQATSLTPAPTAETPSKELENLQQLKNLLGSQICQTYGQNPGALRETRFFNQATNAPDILDIRVAQFLNQSFENCENKAPETLAALTALTAQVEQTYINQAKKAPATSLPTRIKAKEILGEEQVETTPQDEQKVAEQVTEEIQQIEEETSNIPEVVEKEISLLEEVEEQIATESGQTTDLVTEVVNDEQTIIEDIIQSDEPTEEEIVQKEEQIIEEIIDSAENGETSPLVEELPEEIQPEITEQITTEASPTPTPAEASPTPTDTTIIEEVVETTDTTTETTAEPVEEPAPEPEVAAPTL